MTRFVLPHLLPAGFHVRDVQGIGVRLSHLAQKAPALKWLAVGMLIMACAILFMHRNSLWNHELSSLSPISATDMASDARLLADMAAPAVRYVIVVSGEKLGRAP